METEAGTPRKHAMVMMSHPCQAMSPVVLCNTGPNLIILTDILNLTPKWAADMQSVINPN